VADHSTKKNKFALTLTRESWDGIIKYLQNTRPQSLFLDKKIRRLVAKRRASYFRNTQKRSNPAHAIDITVRYNSAMMEKFIEAPFMRLLYPLVTIDPIFERIRQAKVLSVGPRNEMELLALLGLGFHFSNIKALDLISNSPLVEVGDMHDLPYGNSSFDVVINSWVLLYSRRQQRVIDELIRVVKNNGLIAIGMTRYPPDAPDRPNWIESDGSKPNYLTNSEVLRFFGDHVADIPFRHEPLDPSQKGGLMMILRIRKT